MHTSHALRGVHTAYDVVHTKVRRNRACLEFCVSRRTASYDVARSANAADTSPVFDYDVARRRTQCERPFNRFYTGAYSGPPTPN